MSLTPMTIATAWASCFAHDSSLKAWSVQHFGKEFDISIGADMRRQPSEEDAPCMVIFPDAYHVGGQRKDVAHELGLLVGIADDTWISLHGVRTMRALVLLDELCPLIESGMRLALPKARVQDVEVAYEISTYPLVMALFTISVEQSLPVGMR